MKNRDGYIIYNPELDQYLVLEQSSSVSVMTRMLYERGITFEWSDSINFSRSTKRHGNKNIEYLKRPMIRDKPLLPQPVGDLLEQAIEEHLPILVWIPVVYCDISILTIDHTDFIMVQRDYE